MEWETITWFVTLSAHPQTLYGEGEEGLVWAKEWLRQPQIYIYCRTINIGLPSSSPESTKNAPVLSVSEER